ncbi:MAG: UDP-glucose--hexose-1-phosphate uridylyltransferase [Candidatus Sumerlaeota bacterium]
MDSVFYDKPHRRYNPLLDEWTLVSPHRAKRPWQGQVEDTPPDDRPQYDPKCYLCPGNTRTSGAENPKYESTFVFDNDFAALLPPDKPQAAEYQDANGLIYAREERGLCRVICFSPRHDLTLPRMEVAAIRKVVDLWAEQYEDLGSKDFIRHVQIIENKGAMMGCSNPHPHGQIWANESLPYLAGKKTDNQERYYQSHGTYMLSDYLDWEIKQEERIVLKNEHFVWLVPFWAVWPFETCILPRRAVSSILELDDEERSAWAELLKQAMTHYDNLFNCTFPYSMGISQKPTDQDSHEGVVLHQVFFPPLLRSATVRKFQVGYEMSAEPQRDITAEQAATRLRDLSDTHYLDQ